MKMIWYLIRLGGGNTTGFCAEKLKRKWITIEVKEDYGVQSLIRFEEKNINSNIIKTEYYNRLLKGGDDL